MESSDLATNVADALTVDPDDFQRRVREESESLKTTLHDGSFDNPQSIVGFEYEFYAVDEEDCALTRVPRRLLEYIGFEKELGLHNAELTCSPQPLNADGLHALEASIKAHLSTALAYTRTEGMRLVSDGMWTIPPKGERAFDYLTDSVEDRGVVIAANMSESVRYHAMANAPGTTPRMVLDAPHVHLAADTVMPESLITSIQPHYQVPYAPDLPDYFRYALRVAGPLLALGVNSPFFPPDLYDDVPADEIITDGWMEHRIPVFETVLNRHNDVPGKVRFPRDLESVQEAVDRIAADETVVPMAVEPTGRFDDQFAHFRRKHGTYWRWVRPVFEGATPSSANARIEFRPIAAQPTVRDSVSFLAAFAGLLESMVRREHPVSDLSWDRAHGNFYGAMREGLDAKLRWVTNDGTETTNLDVLYDDLFAHAADGLELRGLDDETIETYLWPLRRRVETHTTPASWKRQVVSDRFDTGDELATAITTMQRTYVNRQRETLLEGSFADWLVDRT